MGSTGHYWGREFYGRKAPTVKQYLDEQHTSVARVGDTWTILKSVTKAGVYYAACRRTYANGDAPDVFALVMPYQFYGKGYDRELIVKDVDESMGPVHYDCPDSILDLLTPTDSKYANEWRAKCREHNVNQTRLQVAAGNVIRFASPLNYGAYGQVSEFRVTEWGRRKRFRAIVDGRETFLCRIQRSILSRGFEIVS